MTKGARWLGVVLVALVAACSGDPVVGGRGDASDDLAKTSDVGAAPDVTNALDVTDAPDAPKPMDAPNDMGPPRCGSNADCAGRVCDTASGRCVECVASADTCPAERHCDATTNTCVAGCRSDEGCRSTSPDGGVVGAPLRCDLARHECVACLTDAHCPAGNLCVGNACVTGCNDRQPCPTGQTCCDGACVDTDSNRVHCGTARRDHTVMMRSVKARDPRKPSV